MELSAAVIGTGHLGRHHARIYAEMEDVKLVAVCDLDLARAGAIAEKYGCRAYEAPAQIRERLDLVSVAVPTHAHFEVASYFLRKDVPVLVEKPMTATLAQARELAQLSFDRKIPLQVGHVERFNPALRAALQHKIEARFIESHRLAPFTFRSADIGVVLDLMIHDIDIVLHLVRSPLMVVHAQGGSVLSSSEDIASARLEFEDGAVANLTASRVSLNPMRRTRVFSRDFFLSMDFDKKYAFLARKAEGFESRLKETWEQVTSSTPEQMALLAATAFRDLIQIQELKLDDEEPLKAELQSFVRAVRTGEPPEVPAHAALRALEAADRVLADIRRRRW